MDKAEQIKWVMGALEQMGYPPHKCTEREAGMLISVVLATETVVRQEELETRGQGGQT